MATVPHVTSGSGLRKFQADGFLFNRVYQINICSATGEKLQKSWGDMTCRRFHRITTSIQQSGFQVQQNQKNFLHVYLLYLKKKHSGVLYQDFNVPLE